MMNKTERGNLFTIAAPSGTGKTTLVRALIESTPGITVSISHTTRPKRPAEVEGINYYFVEQPNFQQMIDNKEFLEHATVFKHFYGTSKQWVENTLNKGLDVILEIDWQGCQQIKKMLPDCISIFILPPSLDALSYRLKHRNQDNHVVIKERFADVRETISHSQEFDYMIMNDDFDTAVRDLRTIILASRLLERRQHCKFETLLRELKTIQ